MTRNESFKRRVRSRMAKTGEKYGAARRVLIEQAAANDRRTWVSDPEQSDAAVRKATGRGWDEWCDLVETWPGHREGRRAVTAWLQAEHELTGWWAMSVTLGWERISGRRLPGQRPDGTFSATRSATITTDAAALREMLLDPEGRADLFPGRDPELRSRTTSKSVRLALDTGVAEIMLEPREGDRVTVHVEHAKLTGPEDVAHWRLFWGDWLAALDEAGA